MPDARRKLRRELRGLMLRRSLPLLLAGVVFSSIGLLFPGNQFWASVIPLMFVPLAFHFLLTSRWRHRPRAATLRLLIHWQGETGGNGFHLLWSDGALWFVPEPICPTENELTTLLRRVGLDGFAVEKKSAYYRGGWEREWREGRLASDVS